MRYDPPCETGSLVGQYCERLNAAMLCAANVEMERSESCSVSNSRKNMCMTFTRINGKIVSEDNHPLRKFRASILLSMPPRETNGVRQSLSGSFLARRGRAFGFQSLRYILSLDLLCRERRVLR